MTTMPSVSTETMFMLHSGGTKFYEITLINAADLKTFLVVKRWGKIEAIKGGGEVQVLDYSTPRTALQAAEKLKNDKEKRGYQLKDPTHGLGGNFAASGTADILSAIKGHYTKHWPMVIQHLGLIDDSSPANDDDDEGIVSEQPLPEPDRGDTWGSW
jgi:predicted DNA-binding WGR domain protein